MSDCLDSSTSRTLTDIHSPSLAMQVHFHAGPSKLFWFVLLVGINDWGCFCLFFPPPPPFLGVDAQQGDVQGQNQANDENRPPQRRRQGIFPVIFMKRLLILGFWVHVTLKRATWLMYQKPRTEMQIPFHYYFYETTSLGFGFVFVFFGGGFDG